MVLLRKTLLVSGALLLPWNACWATGSTQSQQATPVEPAATSQPSQDQSRAAQAGPALSNPPPASPPAQSQAYPAPAGSPAQTPADAPPAGLPPQIDGVPQPAVPPAPAAAMPAQTANPSLRFNMQENGQNRTADEFDAWLEAQGVRVSTGIPAIPLVQNCPLPDGDRGDNDSDRVINCLDQCPGSQAGQVIGRDGCATSVSIDLKGVTFAYDEATLDPSAKAVLDQAVEILKRHEALKVEVAGHTDSRGDAEYNQKLSERRAKAVYDYLVENGVDAARLIGPIGLGETRPLVPNERPDGSDDPEARSGNRRTELNIQN
jgi:outer membrane protein OmpA-like peptidoglycan-associated protein